MIHLSMLLVWTLHVLLHLRAEHRTQRVPKTPPIAPPTPYRTPAPAYPEVFR